MSADIAHSEQGALRGEHPGVSRNPLIKVTDVAWVEFDKPDLSRAATFAEAFGFHIAAQDSDELHLRGSDAGAPCVIIRRGPQTRFGGLALRAGDEADLRRLADKTGATVVSLPDQIGGKALRLVDPSGNTVKVVAGLRDLPVLPGQQPHVFNFGQDTNRTNVPQRSPYEPTNIQRLGHVMLASTNRIETLDWYLEHFGLIVSDFLYAEGHREQGPLACFVRCDRGSIPTDHHTIAIIPGTSNHYDHSAYQVSDLDALAVGGQYLGERGYFRSWGIGRHVKGSQIFDYWRDPDGFMVEHFTDGDLFDNTVETGWAPLIPSNMSQWGPPPSADFQGTMPAGAPGRGPA